MRVPRGGASCLGVGRPGSALSLPRPLGCSGVRPGPTTRWVWVRGMRARGPVTNPTACALASWLCALLGRHEGARGGRLLPGCGASGDGRSPTPDFSSVRACGRGPLPTGCGCGGCGRGDPSATPQCALLLAGFARCAGGMRVPGGGASCPGVGRPGSGALPTPTTQPFGHAAGAHYLLAVGAGDAGMGTPHQPHSARSCELALCAVGAARGRPGGAPLAWVWGVRGRALSHPRLLVRLAVRPGPTTQSLWVRGMRAWGPLTNPTARALASWLCALCGRHECARGGRLLPGCGAFGDGRSPTPDFSFVRACGRGPLPTGCGCGGCGRGDPSATPQCALLLAGFARCAGGMRVPGGGASCPGVGRPGSGALPTPTTQPFGHAAGAHYLLAVGAGGTGVGTRHQPHSARSCELALCAVGAARGRPGGGASCLGVGRSGTGALPPPTSRSFGRAAGAHYPIAVGAGDAGMGTPHQPHSARSCELALCAVGAARVRPGGAPLAWVWGVRGRALSHPRLLVRSGVRPGPTTHWLWVRGVRAWGPVTNPTARAPASPLCALWGRHEGAQGGRLLPGCGASGDGRSPTPDHSSVRACGRGPLPTGCGCVGCGRGDP